MVAKGGKCGMKEIRTTTCGRHGHPEFLIPYDPAVAVVSADVEWFISWLEESVAEGVRFKPGQSCQVGWSVTEVRQHESGDLTMWEPDMRSLPIEWLEGVSHTLMQLRVQKDVVESVMGAEELSFPSIRQSVIICNRLGRDRDVVIERVEPNGADSGWFCGCRQESHDHNDAHELRRVSLFEAAFRHAPQIVPYMALPPGMLVYLSAGAPALFRSGQPLEIRTGSYLAEKDNGR